MTEYQKPSNPQYNVRYYYYEGLLKPPSETMGVVNVEFSVYDAYDASQYMKPISIYYFLTMKLIKTITISYFFCALLFAQDFMEISWRSLDAEFNKEFIGAYRDTVKKYNRQLLRDAPKKDDKVLVTVSIKDNSIDLKSITGSSNDGRYKPFVDEYLEKLDESILEKLKEEIMSGLSRTQKT